MSENIHILDSEMSTNIISMLKSKEESTIRLALSIINNTDFRDKESCTWLQTIIHNSQFLKFAYFEDEKKERIILNFCYDDGELYVDDDVTTESMYSGYVGN